MHTDLRDLLPAVEAEAPPLRRTADDVLKAARRRRTSRRATFASAAAVLLIGAAVAVPRGTPDDQQPVGHVTYPTIEWTANLAEITVGRLTVSKGVQVTPAFQEANVTDGVHRLDSGRLATVATVTVFRPGALDPGAYLGGESLTINGRPGKYVPSVAYDSFSTARPAVVWEYEENAFALITDMGVPQGVTRDEMVDLAAAVSTTGERPVRVGFRLSYVPPDYTLAVAGQADGRSFLQLVKGAYPRTLRNAGIDPGRSDLRLSLAPVDESKLGKGCEGNICHRLTPDGKQALVVMDNGVLSADELRKVTNGVTFSSAGYPAADVVP